jgi:hypothetical protein
MRAYAKKADRPNYTPVLHHLQEVWTGTRGIVKKGNCPFVACKLKHLFLLAEKYVKRINSQEKGMHCCIAARGPLGPPR